MHPRTAHILVHIRQIHPWAPCASIIHASQAPCTIYAVTRPYYIWKSLVMNNANGNTLYLVVDCSVVAVLSASSKLKPAWKEAGFFGGSLWALKTA